MTELVHLIDGAVVIYKRSRSRRWQCRYKLDDGKWRRTSTKHHDQSEAKKAALRIYYEGQVKRANRLPIDAKRFDHVARAVVEQLQAELDSGAGKSVYRRSDSWCHIERGAEKLERRPVCGPSGTIEVHGALAQLVRAEDSSSR